VGLRLVSMDLIQSSSFLSKHRSKSSSVKGHFTTPGPCWGNLEGGGVHYEELRETGT
jgi:hypothetical protein